MDENQTNEKVESNRSINLSSRYIKLKPFSFLILIFTLVLATAGVTMFSLTTGEEKVVEVVKTLNRTRVFKSYMKPMIN